MALRKVAPKTATYGELVKAAAAIDNAKFEYRMGNLEAARDACDKAATCAGEAQNGFQTMINERERTVNS